MDYAVKKSTTPLIKPLKQKHMNTLCEITYHREIHTLFRALGRSMREPNWIVVFKSLVLIHILMREGNTDAVIREVLEYPEIIDTRDFRDKSMNALSVAQSKNIRHYAQYLKEKTSGFNDLKLDFVRQKSEVISSFRTVSVDNPFLRQLTILQRQIKALLECSLSEAYTYDNSLQFYADEIDNVVTLQAFRLLVGDMMSLFHIMNEGVIRLLSGYFDLPREEAQKGLGIYKTFATQTTKTVEFFEIARKLRDSLGVEVPKFKHAPLSLAGALEEYLNAPDFDIQQQAFQAKKQASSQANSTSSQKSMQVIPPPLKQQPSHDAQYGQAPSPVRAPSPVKSPEVLIDFFASTDTAAMDVYSFNMPTVNTWAPSGMVLSGSSNGVVNSGFGAGSNSFAFNSTGSTIVGGVSGGNPFAQQGFAQPGGFPNAGLNGASQFGQVGQEPSSLGFGQQLPLASASTQFGQPSTAPVDPSFTVENIFGSGATGAPVAANNNPFGSAPTNPFGANQSVGFGARSVAASSALSNNPFGSAPAPATNNPFQSQPQPPLPQQFKSQPQQQSQFSQQQQFGSGNPFPSASPIVQQQQLYGSGFGGISNQPSPLLGQQQLQFGSGFPSTQASPMLSQQQPQFGQQQFGFNQQQQQQPSQSAGFNSGLNSFGGNNNQTSGPASQVVDHFAGVNPFAKPNIPLSAMGSGANTPNQMGAIGTTPLYGGNTGIAFNNNQGITGMNLQNGGQNGGFPSVQKNNSNNPFFK
ncbi:UNVERIFIED_CONTAM: hypothetical protein HDU68_008021 [Siphonaria sp. JEL0065]|nr:hypothetical protein HDU68_008021 [Siphonaria sp. JEL0065]